MKQITILSGKAMIVELPEGAIKHNVMEDFIDESKYWLCYKSKDGKFESIPLPPGTWQIVGMLSEVTESEVAQIVKLHATIKKYRDYLIDNDRPTDMFTKTAPESLESAILAERYSFSNIEINPDDFKAGTFSSGEHQRLRDRFESAQSRVLCRELCLLLRRTDG